MSPSINPLSPLCPLLESLTEVMHELHNVPDDAPDFFTVDLVEEAERIAAEVCRAIVGITLFHIAVDVDLFARRQIAAWESRSCQPDGPRSWQPAIPPGGFDLAAQSFSDQFPG